MSSGPRSRRSSKRSGSRRGRRGRRGKCLSSLKLAEAGAPSHSRAVAPGPGSGLRAPIRLCDCAPPLTQVLAPGYLTSLSGVLSLTRNPSRAMQTTFSATPKDLEHNWHVVDAEGKPLGRLASEVAQLIRGKHKPTFTPHMDGGDRSEEHTSELQSRLHP